MQAAINKYEILISKVDQSVLRNYFSNINSLNNPETKELISNMYSVNDNYYDNLEEDRSKLEQILHSALLNFSKFKRDSHFCTVLSKIENHDDIMDNLNVINEFSKNLVSIGGNYIKCLKYSCDLNLNWAND